MTTPQAAFKLAEMLQSKHLSPGKHKEILELCQKNSIHKPNVVVNSGMHLIKSGSLGPAVWAMWERVCMAALECNDSETADTGLKNLTAKFGRESSRVQRLEAMRMEANGDFTGSLKIYSNLIEKDNCDSFSWKRKICIYKATGNKTKAVKELTSYLKVFLSDEQAWSELGEMHIAAGKFDLAKFCLEELLLLHPENFLYHVQYAELLCSSSQGFDKARQHLAQALELNGSSVRSLYLLILVLRTKGGNVSHRQALLEWAEKQLLKAYQDAGVKGDRLGFVKASLEQM